MVSCIFLRYVLLMVFVTIVAGTKTYVFFLSYTFSFPNFYFIFGKKPEKTLWMVHYSNLIAYHKIGDKLVDHLKMGINNACVGCKL